jgi:formylglycine-generating enzyme required for sulfatase activity
MQRKRRKTTKARPIRRYVWVLVLGVLLGYSGTSSCFADESTGSRTASCCLGFDGPVILPKFESDLEMSIYGLRRDAELRVYLGDGTPVATMSPEDLAAIPQGEPSQILVQLSLAGEHLGFKDLSIEQGDHVHTRKNFLFLSEEPKISGELCGARTTQLDLRPGQVIPFETSQREYVKLTLKDSSAEHPLVFDGGQVKVPSLTPGDYDLVVTTDVAGLESQLLCTQELRIGGSDPRFEKYILSYEPASQTLRMEAQGSALPERFAAIVQCARSADQELTFAATAGNADERTYRVTAPQNIRQFCSILSEESGRRLFRAPGRWIVESADKWTWQWLKSSEEARLYDFYQEENYGKIRLDLGESYEFSRVPVGDYSIGLTSEKSADPQLTKQRLAVVSAHRNGVVQLHLVRPFLIGVYEITNRQFLAWVKSVKVPEENVPRTLLPYLNADLPPNLADLPVTDVSYDGARRFARWLQETLAKLTSRWQIRLPHELEWEMAARGGTSQDYVFKEERLQEGLASLATGRILPVGSNPLDSSIPVGARDMAGNVREWTASVINEQMLNALQLSMSMGAYSGWDPATPYAIRGLLEETPEDILNHSKNMVVRGGANGEEPPLFLTSLRRQLEIADRKDAVGFRLVLVPIPVDEH